MSSAPNSGVAADLHLRLVQGGSWAITYDNLGGVQNLGGHETRLTTHNISPMFSEPDDNADSVAIEVRFVIRRYRSSIAPHFAHNDTAVYVQKFYDYYAYDDGTAENGYGVFGENSQAAEIAVRYHSYRRDTLTGVFIYFNHSIGGGNIGQPFLLNIRAGGAVPSETLYTLQCTTQFDGLNRFVWYPFKRRVVVEGDFFVGIKQQNTTMLNIGVDANNINAGKVFVRLDLGWKPSQMDSAGVLMIRPSFARRTDFTDIPTLAPAVRRQGAPALYPNPVVSEARLALPSGAEGIAPSGLTINVLDIMGRSVRRLPFAYAISAEGLPAGVYLLQVEYPDGAPAFAVRKFVVIR